jgi:hypothetical protein
MAITKPKISTLVASQLPEFIREDYPTFVAFLQAYYEYLETTQVDLVTIRDIDKTLDSFIEFFKDEVAPNSPIYGFGQDRERFNLSRIKDQHLAKGSELSYKFLFRLLFNKNVTIQYPGTQVLRASDGKWIQDVSIFAKVNVGNPDDVVGRLIDVVTPNKVIRVLVDRRQDVEIEVDRYVQISPDTYEFYIDRRFFGSVNIGDRIRYEGIFDASIVATTSKVSILQAGKEFKAGQLFNIRNGAGAGSILKVKSIDSDGGIVSAEFVKYGIGYETDFTSTLVASQSSTVTGAGGTSLNISTSVNGITGITINSGGSGYTSTPTVNFVGGGYTTAATVLSVERSANVITKINISNSGAGYVTVPSIQITGGGGSGASATAIIGNRYNYNISEALNTFDEQGFINYSDYSQDEGNLWLPTLAVTLNQLIYYNDRLYTVTVAGTTSTTPPSHTSSTASNGSATLQYTRQYGPAFDGAYSGQIIRQFYVQSSEAAVEADAISIIKVELGPLTKYPGYYQNNDGFLDDAIFIQDSKYYQAFSYVLKINEKLETYKSAVKTLIHPSGIALFGEYDIRNDFDISASLEFLMKIFSVFEQDEIQTDDSSFKDISKPLGAQLQWNGDLENTSVTVPDAVAKFITKGNFTESPEAHDLGSIVWNHVDFGAAADVYNEGDYFLDDDGTYLLIVNRFNYTIPMLETTEHWEKYEDSFEFTDSNAINLNKSFAESITPSESRETMTFVNQIWAGWGEVYSGEDYFLDDDGTYLIPTEFTVDGIVYPSEVVVAQDAPAVTTNKYTTDTLTTPTDVGDLWVNQYVDLLYFADDDGDYGVGRTQTF